MEKEQHTAKLQKFLNSTHCKIFEWQLMNEKMNSMYFAPVPCNANINKSSASHFCPVRVRILWLLAAVNCSSLPFTFASSCGRASLFPPSLPCPFHFQLTQARFHFSVSYSASIKGTVANSMLYAYSLFNFCTTHVCHIGVLKQVGVLNQFSTRLYKYFLLFSLVAEASFSWYSRWNPGGGGG